MSSTPLRRRAHAAALLAVLVAGVASSLLMQPTPRSRAVAPPAVVLPLPRPVAKVVRRAPVVQRAAAPHLRHRFVRTCAAPDPVAADVPVSTAASTPPSTPATTATAIGPLARWAVLVGVQDYAGSTHPTIGGRGDVTVIRAALLRSGWRADHILTLIDCQATGQSIEAAMSWLASRSGPSTYSLFHFSGHACIVSRGPCAAGHTYLWGQDNTFISEATVGALLGRVRGPAWFDFAACEAGAFDAGLSSPLRLVTGSSQAHETAYEVPAWRESVWSGFTWDQAFLQGQTGAAPGSASIGDMVAYGRAHAPAYTAGQARGAQHPYAAGGDPSQTLFAPHVPEPSR